VDKHTCSYLDTTLHVSGFKVTKFSSLSSSPLFWTKTREECKADDSTANTESDAFWEYVLDLGDFNAILIPSQVHGDIFSDLTSETKRKLKRYIEGGGCLICCHFRATALLNYLCGVSWHEISVKIGSSQHVAKAQQVLEYKNDVRGVVNIRREDVIYKTRDDFVTVAMHREGKGSCYYIGHDFAFLWEKSWNRVLFDSIRQRLSNTLENAGNLDFNAIDVEAFKNLNIQSHGDGKGDEEDLDEFQPDFPESEPVEEQQENDKGKGDGDGDGDGDGVDDVVFDGFDELDGFDQDGDDKADGQDGTENAKEDEENVNPETETGKLGEEYESIGYIQMDDDGVVTMENRSNRLRDAVQSNGDIRHGALMRIDEDHDLDGSETDNGSLEEVD